MTKFDIRVRRKRFTQGRIESHKNYQSLIERHYESGRKRTRGMMVLVFLVILVIAILLVFFSTTGEQKQESPKDQVSFNTSFVHIENIGNKTVYKL
ncbi:MAG: hypothetical protein KAR17_23365 [Cyclobacteriaceae bacterium]|nr:hypothetical protein [Cyclobacteriaceae bacterium]